MSEPAAADGAGDSGGGLVHDPRTIRRLAFVGFAGSVVGIGLSRFAYTPLVPVLVEEGWVTTAQAGYLGAVNFAGYFVGALTAWWLGQRLPIGRVAVSSLLICAASLALAAVPWGFEWLMPWRFLAGYGGGVVMVLVPPALLSQIPAERWGFASGAAFAGVGAGIAASGTVVPLLARLGATPAWIALALVSLLLTGMVHKYWREPAAPDAPAAPDLDPAGPATPDAPAGPARGPRLPAILLCTAYGLYAVGMAPHSIFWVDFLARDLGLGLAVGGLHWAVLGLVSAAAPLAAGPLAARFSFGSVLCAGLAVMAAGVLLPVLTDATALLFASSVLTGMMIIASVALFAGRTAEIAGREGQRRLWWIMTLLFALGQAVGSWGLSWLFDLLQAYRPLFATGAAALFAAAILTLPALNRPRQPGAGA